MLTADDLKAIEDIVRHIVKEELAAAKRNDDLMDDEAYLLATTTPQERNKMVRQQRAAGLAAAKLKGTSGEGSMSTATIPETGFMRVPDILKFIPVSRATWWLWVKEGRAPKGVHFGPKITAWRAEDICDLIKELEK